MRAAVLHEAGGIPIVEDVDEPVASHGGVLVHVSSAALNPHDLVVAAGIREAPPVPYVPGTEGVGTLPDGSRAYFGLTIVPNGSFAERAVARLSSIQSIPDELSDGDALSIGIAGTSAWLPLTWKAGLQQGEQVLVLGATGSVGQIAVQAANLLGARRVVAAGRNRATLERLLTRGADDVVVLEGDYADALIEAAAGGFDVVIDTLFGEPMVAGLRATRPGGRLVSVGMRAGRSIELSGIALKGRDLLTFSGDQPPTDVTRAAFADLAGHVVAGDIVVDFETLPLEAVADAWKRQADSPNTKLVLVP